MLSWVFLILFLLAGDILHFGWLVIRRKNHEFLQEIFWVRGMFLAPPDFRFRDLENLFLQVGCGLIFWDKFLVPWLRNSSRSFCVSNKWSLWFINVVLIGCINRGKWALHWFEPWTFLMIFCKPDLYRKGLGHLQCDHDEERLDHLRCRTLLLTAELVSPVVVVVVVIFGRCQRLRGSQGLSSFPFMSVSTQSIIQSSTLLGFGLVGLV